MRTRVRLVLTPVLIAAACSVACESLLGIDEEYVMPVSPAASGGVPMESGGASGGFIVPGTSGSTGTGGIVVTGTGGTAGAPVVDAGGGPSAVDGGCDAGSCVVPDPCALGHYEGTFTGTHTLLEPLPNVPLAPPVAGSLAFEIARDQRGKLAVFGDLVPPAGALSSFSARIEGTLDCASGKLDAKLVGGQLTLTPLIVIHFEGTISGTYDPKARTVNGDWTEAETPRTGAAGSGSWTATWSGT